jgi:hypothetical protein
MRTPRYVGCFRSLRGRFFVPCLALPESSLELGDDALRELVLLLLQVQPSDS